MPDVERTSASASVRWRNVDSDAASAARYLDRLSAEMAEVKARVTALLHLAPGQTALKVGCGLGRDTEAMAQQVASDGHAVGLDLSRELILEASARTAPLGLPLRFAVGSVMTLPFKNASFDAVRIERILQHLPDPAGALAEIARVLRPGCRLAALEPDWHTAVVAGGPLKVLRAYVRQKAEVAAAQGGIGRELPWLIRNAGCTPTEVWGEVLVMRDLATADFVLGLRVNLAGAVEANTVTAEEVEKWFAALEERDHAGAFFAAVNGVVVGATRD